MRRLTRPARNQRGATAMIVVISLFVLLGFAAAAVDLGGASSDHQQLQNGADAGAMAVAQTCALGNCVDSSDQYAKANKLDGQATGEIVGTVGNGTVTVETASVRTNWFGGLIGIPTTTLTARATAIWGWPSGGATLPLTFSWCAFYEATGGWDDQGKPLADTEAVIHVIERSCTPPAHNEVPGGFGWLSGVNCTATVLAGN